MKNINKKEENIVLDEETKKDEKKKPDAKKIVFATILILLAVIFVVLGFCLCLGAFDCLNAPCNVANAFVGRDSVGVISNQFYSGITFENYSVEDLNNLYGFFINCNFDYNPDTCPFPFAEELNETDIKLFEYTLDDKTFEFFVRTQFGEVDGKSIKGFYCYASTVEIGADMYVAYATPDISSLFSDYEPILYCGYFDGFGTNHITNFVFSASEEYKSYISQIINFSWAFSSGSGISQNDYNQLVADRDRIQQEYNDFMNTYNNAFSYVPIIYKSPSDYSVLERKYIDKDTTDTVFIISEKIPITDIIDNNGNLIYNIQPDVSVSGLWERYWTMHSFNDFHAFLFMAYSTPLSYRNDRKGILYSYDSTYHRLIKYSEPVTFATEKEEQLYNDIKQQHYNWGKADVEKSKQSTIDGVLSVLQSPIDFLKNAFSFEVLGINVSGVVFFILSIVIVAFVVKKVV